MAGPTNETTAELLALRSASAGGLLNPGGGNNVQVNQSSYTAPGLVQNSASLTQSGGVHYSRFP
jgi:hypothetical protein